MSESTTDASDIRVSGLTVLLPTKREAGNLPWLIRRLHEELDDVVGALEILIVDAPTDDGTEEIAKKEGCTYIADNNGFAEALRIGFRSAKHPWIVTMDADGSHDPVYVRWLLRYANQADLVINSRYLPRAGQESSWFRTFTSKVLNQYLGIVCSMPIKDLSGGFKLYRKAIFDHIKLESRAFEIQSEIGIKAYGMGFRLLEVPFYYRPRMEGTSKAAIFSFGMAFLKRSLLLRSWRNSRHFCDYDERAYNSRIPIQRIWQRKRHAIIMSLMDPFGRTLNVGCGTDRLVIGYPNVVGVDTNLACLRYLANDERKLIQADATKLPFADGSFEKAYCCEVIEHIDDEAAPLAELYRILEPGGTAVISTPNYGGIAWPLLEKIYEMTLAHHREGHKHPTRHTRKSLRNALEAVGFAIEKEADMYGSILFVKVRKPK